MEIPKKLIPFVQLILLLIILSKQMFQESLRLMNRMRKLNSHVIMKDLNFSNGVALHLRISSLFLQDQVLFIKSILNIWLEL